MAKLRTYRDTETLPKWNLDKLQKTGDLRYLLILSDYNELPKIDKKDFELLTDEYNSILSQIDNLDLRLQYLFLEANFTLYAYLIGEVKEQICINAFFKYMNYLNVIYKSFDYDNKTFDSSNDLYKYLKEKLSLEDLPHQRLKILDYRHINAKLRSEYDLYEDVIILREIMPNQPINIKTISVKEYDKLKQYAIKKSQQATEKNRKN